MIQSPSPTLPDPNSYERLGRRVQRAIADPKVQKVQTVTVIRQAGESPDDWRRLIEEISQTAGIRVDQGEDGSARIGWREYCDA